MPDHVLAVLLGAGLLVLVWVDLRLFAPGREPRLGEAVAWSVGWLALGLGVAVGLWAAAGPADAGEYVAVYLVERALSLDNLFVFLLLFAAFAVPRERRSRLLLWGIAGALVVRGAAIVAGTALIDRFDWVLYVLGAGLLVLAVRMLRGAPAPADPRESRLVRAAERVLPGRASPLVLCLVAIVGADVAFAIDSIPAAFAITRDPLLIWLANATALLGLRSLFVLVEALVERFRYMDETLALVLGAVGVKLLVEDVVHIGPGAGLAVILGLLGGGLLVSLAAERRERRRVPA